MVPHAFVVVDALPLTATGEVHREALPAPGAERPVLDYAYVAPASDLETTIGRIWQEVLGLEHVGVHDNFFDLGGHSLLMVRAHHRIQAAVRGTVPLVELFRHPTVHALATHLGRERAGRRELADVAIDASLVEAETRAERQRQARARRRGPTTYGEAEP
jgi:aryl carrier-like protein